MPDIAGGNIGNSLLDMIYGQQSDPMQQASDWSNNNQARNRVAAGMDLQGNILPSQPGAQPSVGAGQITGAPQDPTAAMQQTGMLSPGDEPKGTKTPQSLGSIMLGLQRRDEAAAGLQQSIGLGMSAFARPENRERVYKSFAPGAPENAMQLGQGLMGLSSQQQGQDRTNALGQMIMDPQRGPAIAKQLNIGWEELKARYQADPAGTGQMIQSFLTPTPDLQNLTGIQRLQGGGGGGANPTLNDAATQIVGKIGGQPAMSGAQAHWRDTHPGQPDSAMPWHVNDPASFAQYIANQDELNKSVATAAETHGHNIGMVTDMNNRIESVQKDPALQTLLNEPGLKKTVAKSLINDSTLTPTNILAQSLPSGISFSPEEMRVIDNLRQLKGGQYANALHALGLSRPSEREIEGINSGLGQITNLDLDYNTYKEQGLGQMGDMVKSMMGNSFGASQNFKDMPDYLKTFVDPQYLAGGTRALENNGSEAWAGSTKMSPDEVKEAQNLLTSGKINPETKQPWTRRDVDRLVRSEGKRPFGY